MDISAYPANNKQIYSGEEEPGLFVKVQSTQQ